MHLSLPIHLQVICNIFKFENSVSFGSLTYTQISHYECVQEVHMFGQTICSIKMYYVIVAAH